MSGKQTVLHYVRNTSWMMVSRCLRLLLAFAASVVCARYLGTEYFGLLNYAISFVMLFSILTTLGFDDILVRELVSDAPEQKGSLVASALGLRLIGGMIMTVLVLPIVACLGKDRETQVLMAIICGSAIAVGLSRVFERYFESQVAARYSSLAQMVAVSASFLIVALLAVYHAGVVWFAVARLVEGLVLLFALVLFYAVAEGPRLCRPQRAESVQLLREGAPLMLSGIFILVYMRIDQVMIEHFLGPSPVGCYAVAVRLSEAWYFVPTVIVSSVFPAVLRARTGDPAAYHKRQQLLYEMMTFLGMGVAIPVSLLAGWIIQIIYGPPYREAGPVLALYVWAGVFVFQGVARGKWLVAEGLQRYAIIFTGGACVINVVLNAILIPHVGLSGAAVATVISCFCQTILIPFFVPPVRTSVRSICRSFVPVQLVRSLNRNAGSSSRV